MAVVGLGTSTHIYPPAVVRSKWWIAETFPLLRYLWTHWSIVSRHVSIGYGRGYLQTWYSDSNKLLSLSPTTFLASVLFFSTAWDHFLDTAPLVFTSLELYICIYFIPSLLLTKANTRLRIFSVPKNLHTFFFNKISCVYHEGKESPCADGLFFVYSFSPNPPRLVVTCEYLPLDTGCHGAYACKSKSLPDTSSPETTWNA